MRNYSFPFAAALALLIAFSSQAAEKPRPAQGDQKQPKKVWTNDDMEQLRARGLISIVGQEATEPAAQAPAAQAPAAPAETIYPVYESRLDDPEGMPKMRPIFRLSSTGVSRTFNRSRKRWLWPRIASPSRVWPWTSPP